MFTTSMVWACWTRWMLTLFYPHGWWPCVSLNPGFKDCKNCCAAMAMMKVSKERMSNPMITRSSVHQVRRINDLKGKKRSPQELFVLGLNMWVSLLICVRFWDLISILWYKFKVFCWYHIGLRSPIGNTHPNPLPIVRSGSGPLHWPVMGSFHLTCISGFISWLDQCFWKHGIGSFFEKCKIFRVKSAIPSWGEGLFPLFVFVIEPLNFDGGAQLWLVPGGYVGFRYCD